MNRKYRKTIIACNWKMNMTADDIKTFAAEVKGFVGRARWCDIVICVPFPNIPAAQRAFKDMRVTIGAQNVHHESAGAYTGEVSASMLAALGVKYVIIGHSERRAYFGETDETVNKKVKLALDAGLYPIICVGETLPQREMGVTDELITLQVKSALSGVGQDQIRHVTFAYEPVWAIGTGLTASAEEAGRVGSHIRAVIRRLYGARAARSITIQYGGSMNEENARGLLAMPDIDGGLIGGASLYPDKLAAIIESANQILVN